MPDIDIVALVVVSAALAAYVVTWLVKPVVTAVWRPKVVTWRRLVLRSVSVVVGALVGLAVGSAGESASWVLSLVFGAFGGTIATVVAAAIKGHITEWIRRGKP